MHKYDIRTPLQFFSRIRKSISSLIFASHLDLIDSHAIPCDYSTGPDLSYYTESAQYYYDLIVDSVKYFRDKPKGATLEDKQMASVAYNRIVNATWGMIACGVESLPYAVKLSRSKNWDQNQAASNVWCGLRDADRVRDILQWITSKLEVEKSQLEVNGLLEYLGYLRNREAIPIVSHYILDESVNFNTRFVAAVSLGKIVRKRFEKNCAQAEAIQKASEWLKSNEKREQTKEQAR